MADHRIISAWVGFASPCLDGQIERTKFYCYSVDRTLLWTHIPWCFGNGEWCPTRRSAYGRNGLDVNTLFYSFIFSGTLTQFVFSNAFASLGGGTLNGCLVRFQELSLPLSSCLSCSNWDGSQSQRSLCINVYHCAPHSLYGCIVGTFPVPHSSQGLICLITPTANPTQHPFADWFSGRTGQTG